jgi:hypothetical protein
MTQFFPSSLAQRYVSGLIQTFLELTVTVIYDPELDFLKKKWIMSAELSTRDIIPAFLSCIEICVGEIQTYLQLIFTVTSDQKLDFLKQNWVMSAEWGTCDSLPPFLSCTEICVRVYTDISKIKIYGYM